MTDQDKPRLIEVAFPLKQASLDSVHEKNVRHGHISTLHIWPARRPLAACRAALIATLLPDPGNEAERKVLLEKLAGSVKKKNVKKIVNGREISTVQEYTEGGILHWGRESGPDMDFFREEIKKAYGGRAPRVLDPFAGGGAIPLEAMRLGCEATAVDINPVAWFILKCTLEYPQKLAGQKRPLPKFALESPEFMAEYLKTEKKARKKKGEDTQSSMLEAPEADLAGHVRAWGWWVLQKARQDLAKYYPVVDDKPTVAYLWARTVTCKNCRATIPLLKTLWLCKNDKKRIRLQMKPRVDRSGVDFEIENEPVVGGNAVQKRTHDLEAGRGTMSRGGVCCPVCGGPNTVAMTMDDIRGEGMTGRLGSQMTAVVVEGGKGKEYRIPTLQDLKAAQEASGRVEEVFKGIPFGLPMEPLPGKERHRAVGSQLPGYGFKSWAHIFSGRQLLTLATFILSTRNTRSAMKECSYPDLWIEAINAYLALATDKIADRDSTLCTWTVSRENIRSVFVRYALPMTWDFAESSPIEETSGGYGGAIDWIAMFINHALSLASLSPVPKVILRSSTKENPELFDVILTDPPYYDAIPYSDTMDFFYIWLKRTIGDRYAQEFNAELTNKVDELIQQHQTGPSAIAGKEFYENGMSKAFQVAHNSLNQDGSLVIVFANKQTGAWETLSASLIKAGFVVYASWPIETEMPNRSVAIGTSSLASSVWLVCRKRSETARPGWEDQVLEDMKGRIATRLNQFWDAGIRGPDLIWAATGPALEAYSQHPFVKKADQPDAVMPVSEFLIRVRRIVTDYMVGHLLSADGNGHAAEGLDDLTIYYLLHRQSFGLEDAPVGACILYATSCKLADRDLTDKHDLLAHGKSKAALADAAEDETEAEGTTEAGEDDESTSSSTLRLKKWDQRLHKDLGLNQAGKVAPLIDQVHRIMRLWCAGDVQKVDAYIENQGLRRNPGFPRLVQALIELAGQDTDERRLLESIQNQLTARGTHPQAQQPRLFGPEEA